MNILKILTILILISLQGYSQALFKPGYYAKSIHVTDVYGTVWQTRQAGTFHVISTTYFNFVRYGVSPIDNLAARVSALEARPTTSTSTDLTALIARISALERPIYFSGVDFEKAGDSIRLKPVVLNSLDFYYDGKSYRIKR